MYLSWVLVVVFLFWSLCAHSWHFSRCLLEEHCVQRWSAWSHQLSETSKLFCFWHRSHRSQGRTLSLRREDSRSHREGFWEAEMIIKVRNEQHIRDENRPDFALLLAMLQNCVYVLVTISWLTCYHGSGQEGTEPRVRGTQATPRPVSLPDICWHLYTHHPHKDQGRDPDL